MNVPPGAVYRAIAILSIVAAAGRDAAAGPPAADPVAACESFYSRVTDFKASFTQVVTTKSPRRTFTRSGVVYFKKPGMMRWDYKTPDEIYYVSDGTTLWSYEVEEGIVYRLRLGDSSLVRALAFLAGEGNLRRDFSVSIGKTTKTGLAAVVLRPREGDASFESVTLFVDPASGEVKRTEVVDPLGNVSRLRFSSPSYDPLPASGFKFTPPPGIKVQDVGAR